LIPATTKKTSFLEEGPLSSSFAFYLPKILDTFVERGLDQLHEISVFTSATWNAYLVE